MDFGDNKVFDIVFSIIMALTFITGLVVVIACLVPTKHPLQHVHFLDTNECYNIKSSDIYKGVAYIYFEDNTEIKCSAANVVVYVNHPCDYCDWGH